MAARVEDHRIGASSAGAPPPTGSGGGGGSLGVGGSGGGGAGGGAVPAPVAVPALPAGSGGRGVEAGSFAVVRMADAVSEESAAGGGVVPGGRAQSSSGVRVRLMDATKAGGGKEGEGDAYRVDAVPGSVNMSRVHATEH